MSNAQERIMSELFGAIEVITQQQIKDTDFTKTIKATIVEKIPNSDMYRVQYQKEELRAMSVGQSEYNQGDIVYIIVPDGKIDSLKFILGKTNERTSTITESELDGLSADILADAQETVIELNKILSDKLLTPEERMSFKGLLEKIEANYEDVLDQAETHEVNVEYLEDAYDLLLLLGVIADDTTVPMSENDLIAEIDKNFIDIRNIVNDYYANEHKARMEIVQKISSYNSYNVSISSSNGNFFINGEIDTELKISISRKSEDVTLSIPSSNIRWTKYNSDGIKDSVWGQTGASIEIGNADINKKATFFVEVHVEGALVATDSITIVDFADSESLQLFVQANHPSIQTYNTTSEVYNPDWSTNNLILTLSAYTTSSNLNVVSELTGVVWEVDGVAITSSNSNYELMANGSLKIKTNTLANKDFMRVRVSAEYSDGVNTISAFNISEFSKIQLTSSGGSGTNVSFLYLLTPDGNVFRNSAPTITKRIQAVYMEGETQVVSNLTYKWFYADPNITAQSSNYDVEGGVGWSLISGTNNLDGDLTGYTTNTLNVKANAVEGSEVFKCSVTHGSKPPQFSMVTLVDISDPLQVIIEGNPVFKNSTGSIILRARVLRNGQELLDLTGYEFEWKAYQSDGTLISSWSATTQSVTVTRALLADKGYITCDIYLTN